MNYRDMIYPRQSQPIICKCGYVYSYWYRGNRKCPHCGLKPVKVRKWLTYGEFERELLEYSDL